MAPNHGMTQMGAVNARLFDTLGSEAIRECIAGDASNCPIAAYLNKQIGPFLLSYARVTELTVGTGAIQVTLASEFEGRVSRRFVLDTPPALSAFIREYDAAKGSV